jgi:hypothetical protein
MNFLPQHWLLIAAAIVVGYVLGRKFPQLGMGYV